MSIACTNNPSLQKYVLEVLRGKLVDREPRRRYAATDRQTDRQADRCAADGRIGHSSLIPQFASYAHTTHSHSQSCTHTHKHTLVTLVCLVSDYCQAECHVSEGLSVHVHTHTQHVDTNTRHWK